MTNYQVLARKWRPKDFSSLIGQQAVVTALTNALREGRVAQAYLFSGIRGVGKTTAARVFAKALNCEKEDPELRPCSACPICKQIADGSDLDVLEIDAATYSKVEQVRELAESLRYGPARDRYKVVVLDEVHRLSRQAFDALLKLVEEPPPRLIFIFATTEIDAVPATILSRCQEFHFRRVGTREVADYLAEICRVEKIVATRRALELLARAGEGSVRDSVALLDQLATFGNNTIEEAEANKLLGGLDLALFDRLLGAILAGRPAEVMAIAGKVDQEGWDPRQVHANFLGYCRNALHLVLGGDGEALDLPADECATLAARVGEHAYEDLLRLLHHLLGSETSIRRSDAGALALEIAWLRAAELPKLVRIESLLAEGGLPEPAAPAAPPLRPAPRAATTPPPAHPPAPVDPARAANAVAEAAAAEPSTLARGADAGPLAEPPGSEAGAAPPTLAPPASTAPATPAPAAPGASVERLFEELSLRRPTLAAQLAAAACRFEGGRLEIVHSSGDSLVASALRRASNRTLLDDVVASVFGAGTRWRALERAGAAAPEPPAPQVAPVPPALADHPRVQAVLDVFGGTIAGLEPDDGTPNGRGPR